MLRPRTVFLLAVLLLAPLGAAFAAQDLCTEPVMTVSGLVRGTSEGRTCVWRGLPYAAAPVGELRWKAPQPAEKWEGVRDTVAFGPRCMQKGFLEGMAGPKNISEDCLFLNIWRPVEMGTQSKPQESLRLPVMVWIHGGGYITGGGDEEAYWGDRLAEFGGVVVVSINYRLNIFGFLASPALREEDPNRSTGGYGTLDQVFALKWVHDNIANFGGDPNNVTIFGESAGGWSVCSLLASPLAKGLFKRAIMESGTCQASRTPEAAYQVFQKSFSALKCDFNDLACMRKLPAQEVLQKGSASLLGGFDYVPIEDGYVLKGTPLAMIQAGDYNRAAVMAGTNLDEFAMATKLIAKYYYTLPGDYERKLNGAFGVNREQAAELAGLYPLSEFENRPVLAYGRMFAADACLMCPTFHAATSLAQQDAPVFLYRFDYHDIKFGKTVGAFHGLEVPFVFGDLERGMSKSLFNRGNLDEAAALSKIMPAYWTNFAKTGDPNGPGLPAWSDLKPEDPQVQVLDKEVRSESATFSDRCEFWESYPTPYLDLVDELVASLPVYGLARPCGLREGKAGPKP